MKIDQHSRKRTHLLLGILIVLGLWFGGSFVFGALGKLHIPNHVQADGPVNIWWPTNNAKVSGLQPFKAMVTDKNVSEYDITWSVDGGQQNPMSDSSTDYPHKEAAVDISSWTWHGSGPYHVTFKAVDKNGTAIGDASVDVYGPDAAQGPKTIVSGTTTPAQSPSSPSTSAVIISSAAGVPTANASEPIPQGSGSTVQPIAQGSGSQAQGSGSQSNSSMYLSVIFPGTNASVSGTNTFKASVSNLDVSEYSMYWQVDGGQHNAMTTSNSGTPHKEASVNVGSWTWRGTGPYVIKFTAEKNGQVIASSEVSITVGTSQGSGSNLQIQSSNQTQTAMPLAASTPLNIPTTKPTASPTLVAVADQPSASGNPLGGLKFFVNQNSNAKQTADSWRASRPADASEMDKIANSPEAIWLGGWNANVQSDVANKISAAKSQGATPIFIAYNVPGRDCGSFSAGGASDASSYNTWIQQVASGLNGNKAIVVLEPDGLALTDCLSAQQKTDRNTMLSNAVSTLKNAGAIVYIDAGHPNWISADDMAGRLQNAGISKADGFALNVSNFFSTQDNITYGNQLSQKLGGKHFVIDTARNGNGPTGDNQWCNPSGRALGVRDTTATGNAAVDAFLWLKNPGESDGNCNGGPSAGVWWPDYALGLAQRASY
jgi:endoglucanase